MMQYYVLIGISRKYNARRVFIYWCNV